MSLQSSLMDDCYVWTSEQKQAFFHSHSLLTCDLHKNNLVSFEFFLCEIEPIQGENPTLKQNKAPVLEQSTDLQV